MKIESIIENTIKSVPGIIDIVPLDKNISDNPFLITVNNEKQVSVYFGVVNSWRNPRKNNLWIR